jgi:hypothetical protein
MNPMEVFAGKGFILPRKNSKSAKNETRLRPAPYSVFGTGATKEWIKTGRGHVEIECR